MRSNSIGNPGNSTYPMIGCEAGIIKFGKDPCQFHPFRRFKQNYLCYRSHFEQPEHHPLKLFHYFPI